MARFTIRPVIEEGVKNDGGRRRDGFAEKERGKVFFFPDQREKKIGPRVISSPFFVPREGG